VEEIDELSRPGNVLLVVRDGIIYRDELVS
jgi:hypothetical protein